MTPSSCGSISSHPARSERAPDGLRYGIPGETSNHNPPYCNISGRPVDCCTRGALELTTTEVGCFGLACWVTVTSITSVSRTASRNIKGRYFHHSNRPRGGCGSNEYFIFKSVISYSVTHCLNCSHQIPNSPPLPSPEWLRLG